MGWKDRLTKEALEMLSRPTTLDMGKTSYGAAKEYAKAAIQDNYKWGDSRVVEQDLNKYLENIGYHTPDRGYTSYSPKSIDDLFGYEDIKKALSGKGDVVDLSEINKNLRFSPFNDEQANLFYVEHDPNELNKLLNGDDANEWSAELKLYGDAQDRLNKINKQKIEEHIKSLNLGAINDSPSLSDKSEFIGSFLDDHDFNYHVPENRTGTDLGSNYFYINPKDENNISGTKKIRIADHLRESQFHEPSDFNISSEKSPETSDLIDVLNGLAYLRSTGKYAIPATIGGGALAAASSANAATPFSGGLMGSIAQEQPQLVGGGLLGEFLQDSYAQGGGQTLSPLAQSLAGPQQEPLASRLADFLMSAQIPNKKFWQGMGRQLPEATRQVGDLVVENAVPLWLDAIGPRPAY